MFIEEPALESIYHFVDSLLSNLNSNEALNEKQKFQNILLYFKKDPLNQIGCFQEQMIGFIRNLIKLSAVPNPSHVFSSFKRYLSNYIENLSNCNSQEDSNLSQCCKDENEESYNSFLLRESQKRYAKDYYKFLQEFEKIKSANLVLERKIEEYNQILNRLNDELLYLTDTKEKIESRIADDSAINRYDEVTQKKMADLMFLIDRINEELKSGGEKRKFAPKSNT